MIKKYFALSVITAAVAVAGCSSDDDTPAPDPMDPPVVVLPDADPSNDSSGYDIIANSADHTQLLAAIDSAGLANTLDDPDGDFTIFAPNDAAFDALEAASPGLVAGLTTEELSRILRYHVVAGTVTSTQVSEGVTNATEEAPFTAQSLVDDAVLTFTNPEAGLSVDNVVIETADLAPMGEGATGIVHVIGMVLTPPAEPDPVDPVDPVDPGPVSPGAGTGQAALESAGIYTGFIALFSPQSYDDPVNVWTVFAPTDAAIAAAGGSADAQNHIVTTGALSVADLIAAGSITANSGESFAVAGTDASDLTVGGSAATLLATGDGGALIYSLDGVLAP